MEKQLHNSHQAVTSDDLNRISTMTDKRGFDEILHRLLRVAGSSALFADTESGFFPGTGAAAQLLVTQGSGGNKLTGYGMKIQVGLGFRRMSAAEQPDADLPLFAPMYGAVEKTFTTENADVTNPRVDHVYMKPKETPGNSQTVKIIDAATGNITDESRNTNQAYDYDFQYVAGAPHVDAADYTSGAPSAQAGYVENDLVCKILVLAGSGSIELAQIVDQRTLFEVDTNLIAGVTSLPATNIVVAPTILGQATSQATLTALAAAIVAAGPSGINVGRFEYVSTVSVRIAPSVGDLVKIDCNGAILSSNASIVFTMPGLGGSGGMLETGTHDASTPYYCYVYNVASAITPKISPTPPHDIGNTKPAYHPTNTTWRCVGGFWVDAAGNIQEFYIGAGGRHHFKTHTADHEHALGVAEGTSWVQQAINIPETMTAMLGFNLIDSGSTAAVVWGVDGASQTLPNGASDYWEWFSESGLAEVLAIVTVTSGRSVAMLEIPIGDRSAPAVAYGVTNTLSGGDARNHLLVTGFVDPWVPQV